MQNRTTFIVVILLILIMTRLTSAQTVQTGLPVAHAYYDFKSEGLYRSFSISMIWEDAPDVGYIYPALSFDFQAISTAQGNPRPAKGYTGVQLVNTSKKMIFSIWDNAANSNSAEPSPMTPWCDRFTGEGTGARCLSNYNWIEGREYYFHVRSLGLDETGESWISTITDTVTHQETTIGIIHVKNSEHYNGYGMITDGVSFLEYFTGGNNCDNQPYSRVLWKGPFADQGSTVAKKATAYYNRCARLTSPGHPIVRQEAGGAISAITPDAFALWDFHVHLPLVSR